MHRDTGASGQAAETTEHERLQSLMTKQSKPESEEAKQLKQELEDVSKGLMNAVNARDYGNPLLPKYMSPDFTQEMMDGLGSSLTASNLQEFVTGLVEHVAEEPQFSFDVISSCAEVDLEKGKATVWMTSRLNGYFTSQLQRDGVTMTGAGAFVEGI